MIKLVIAGSRGIQPTQTVLDILRREISIDIEVVSGRARGADRIGESFATLRGYPIAKFPVSRAQWKLYPKTAGHMRNQQMAEYCDAGLLLWDGKSGGTMDMHKRLSKYQKPHVIVTLEGKFEENMNKVIYHDKEASRTEFFYPVCSYAGLFVRGATAKPSRTLY